MAFKSQVTPNIGLVGSPSTVTPTVAAGTSVTVIGLSFANTIASNILVYAKLNKNGGPSAFIVSGATVLPGGALVAGGGDQKIVLEPGDSITAWSNTSTSVDVILSYLV